MSSYREHTLPGENTRTDILIARLACVSLGKQSRTERMMTMMTTTTTTTKAAGARTTM
jgi:hypothetical protein